MGRNGHSLILDHDFINLTNSHVFLGMVSGKVNEVERLVKKVDHSLEGRYGY